MVSLLLSVQSRHHGQCWAARWKPTAPRQTAHVGGVNELAHMAQEPYIAAYEAAISATHGNTRRRSLQRNGARPGEPTEP